MKFLLGGLLAVFAFNALTSGVADVRMFADARGSAFGVLAFLRHLRISVDHERQWSAARGHAIQLATAILLADEHFAIAAFGNRWEHHERRRVDFRALFLRDTAAIGTTAYVSLLACATGDADTRTDGIGLVAGTIATFAWTEFFILAAHLRCNRYGVGGRSAAILGLHAHALFVLQEAGLAEAADNALFGAHGAGMRVGAGWSAGGAARQEDLVVLALTHFRWVGEEHGFLVSRGLAVFAFNALTSGVADVWMLADARGGAFGVLAFLRHLRVSVDHERQRSTACGHAIQLTTAILFADEHFVIAAFRDRWEHHECFRSFALMSRHADAKRVSQVSLLAEAADDAVLGAHIAWARVGAGRSASRTASLEFFIVRARWH